MIEILLGGGLVALFAYCMDEADKEAASRRYYEEQERARAEYEQRLAELAQQEQLCQAELAAIEAEMERDQAWARAAFLRTLTVQERALLEMRLRASAEAEARARYRLDQLIQENRQLTQQLRALGWDG